MLICHDVPLRHYILFSMNTPEQPIIESEPAAPVLSPAEAAAHHVIDLTQNNDVSEILPDEVAAREQGVTILPDDTFVPQEPHTADGLKDRTVVEDGKKEPPPLDDFIARIRAQFPVSTQPGWGESNTGFRTTGGGFGDH